MSGAAWLVDMVSFVVVVVVEGDDVVEVGDERVKDL
jgi:hypothetical protein